MTPQFGYIRVSTIDQNETRQLENIDLDKTFVDHCSGKDTKRPELQRALEHLREGDTLNIHSIDRLARNLQDLQSIVEGLNDRGVTVKFHSESLVFTGDDSPMQKLMFQLLGAVAQFERSLIRERQKEGIEAAKKRGVYRGRKPKLANDQIEEIRIKAENGANKSALAREYKVSRQTIYSLLAKK